jgi:hypothetical protein
MSLAVMPSAAGFEVLERVGTASCGRDSMMDRQADPDDEVAEGLSSLRFGGRLTATQTATIRPRMAG